MCLPREKFVAAYAILSRWPVETQGVCIQEWLRKCKAGSEGGEGTAKRRG